MNLKSFQVFLLLMLAFACNGFAQEKLNYTDESGLKQGKWIKRFENGKILYEGKFKDNEPVGEFKRYYQSGKIISILNHSESTDSVTAVFFYSNGYKAAQGIYMDRNKSGTWRFYSENENDKVICIELYKDNKKEGKSTKYHVNGNKASELKYRADLKHGKWIQYYEDEVICLKSEYIKGKLNGKFETFFPDGSIEIVGSYANDVRVGEWTFLNKDGTLKRSINYINGIADNDSELIREETEYLDMLEKNGGKIKDPAKTGVIW